MSKAWVSNMVRILCSLILIIEILIFPLIAIGLLFGSVGSSAGYFVLIDIGFVGIFIFSITSLIKPKWFPAVIVSTVFIVLGYHLNVAFWDKENSNLCLELRANPTCVEDECGFSCSNVDGFGFSTGGSICRDKNMKLCLEKIKKQDMERAETKIKCEKSGGTYKYLRCNCPFEPQLGQTSDSMYDPVTGYCQTTHGGPGGEVGAEP